MIGGRRSAPATSGRGPVGEWSCGGRFFTSESLFDLALVPAVVAGIHSGRAVFRHNPQRAFLIVVLVLSAGGALELVT